MNLFRRELKAGLKPFLLWTLGLFVFIFAGIVKSSAAMADGQFMTELISKFPRIVVAVMGMANVDIAQFGGFYAVLMQYVFVLTAVYAVHLGNNAVSRESIDKTYEFLFAKPRSRSFILARKLLSALVYLVAYAALNLWFLTERGTAMRAVGANSDMAEAQGINVWRATVGGIGLAGAFSAFSGGLMVQSQGFADVNMGLGILINALAALMIGEAIVGKKTVARQMLAPFAGSVIYYQLISVCLAAGLPPGDLKIATGVFVLVMLAGPSLRSRKAGPMQREAMKE